jgi:hypothetical protein
LVKLNEDKKGLGKMSASKEEYIGKECIWKQLIELFPGKWIALHNYEMDGSTLIKGVVDDIMSDDESKERMIKYIDSNHICRRTTEWLGGSYANVRIIQSRD